ncbi:hypothetical protein TKK_0010470 [Trichogramma kaykai]
MYRKRISNGQYLKEDGSPLQVDEPYTSSEQFEPRPDNEVAESGGNVTNMENDNSSSDDSGCLKWRNIQCGCHATARVFVVDPDVFIEVSPHSLDCIPSADAIKIARFREELRAAAIHDHKEPHELMPLHLRNVSESRPVLVGEQNRDTGDLPGGDALASAGISRSRTRQYQFVYPYIVDAISIVIPGDQTLRYQDVPILQLRLLPEVGLLSRWIANDQL